MYINTLFPVQNVDASLYIYLYFYISTYLYLYIFIYLKHISTCRIFNKLSKFIRVGIFVYIYIHIYIIHSIFCHSYLYIYIYLYIDIVFFPVCHLPAPRWEDDEHFLAWPPEDLPSGHCQSWWGQWAVWKVEQRITDSRSWPWNHCQVAWNFLGGALRQRSKREMLWIWGQMPHVCMSCIVQRQTGLE